MSLSEGRHHQSVCLQHWPQQVHPDWNLCYLIGHMLVRVTRTDDTLIKIFNNRITLLKLKMG